MLIQLGVIYVYEVCAIIKDYVVVYMIWDISRVHNMLGCFLKELVTPWLLLEGVGYSLVTSWRCWLLLGYFLKVLVPLHRIEIFCFTYYLPMVEYILRCNISFQPFKIVLALYNISQFVVVVVVVVVVNFIS